MVKKITVQIAVDDDEYGNMIKQKGTRTWEDVLRQGLEKNKEES